MKIVAVESQKGGTGKTTTALNLAVAVHVQLLPDTIFDAAEDDHKCEPAPGRGREYSESPVERIRNCSRMDHGA